MNPLTALLAEPDTSRSMDAANWDCVIRHARYARLIASLLALFERHGSIDTVPSPVLETMRGSRVYIDYLQLQIRREIDHLAQVADTTDFPVILLKGAAYLVSGLPPASGRRMNDIDLLVPRERLTEFEDSLKARGWRSSELNDYDERYYRKWMHEIPPLTHPLRGIEIDVHHNLTPPTSRHYPDGKKLVEAAVAIEGTPFLRLCDEDLVLHSATHLFFNDELRGGLRDLWDLHLLCAEFSEDEGFWLRLAERALELNLGRPLYYAADTLRRLLRTPVPDTVFTALAPVAPKGITLKLMRSLISRHLAPEDVDAPHSRIVELLLFVRSHWVRMPPLMLARHLTIKWWRGQRRRDPATATGGGR